MPFNNIDGRNAEYLLAKIKNSEKALDCNKELILNYYNEKIASVLKSL